jgi:hypothetical protein
VIHCLSDYSEQLVGREPERARGVFYACGAVGQDFRDGDVGLPRLVRCHACCAVTGTDWFDLGMP